MISTERISDNHLLLKWYLHRLAYLPGKNGILAVKAIDVYFTSACRHKILHTIMYSIELSLHVKGAAFEYYCKIEHVIFF